MISPVKPKRMFLGRLQHGDDLTNAITAFCRIKKIHCGYFTVIGAVKKAVVGYYDQESKKYLSPHVIDKKLEILSCNGNISLKDGAIFVHAHITLSDSSGKACGGHVMKGTTIFAAEITIQEVAGKDYIRTFDSVTGLSLWR